MKKKVCLAMSLLMLAGTVPAQAETIGEAEQITFTAKVGTKELYRNQSRIYQRWLCDAAAACLFDLD